MKKTDPPIVLKEVFEATVKQVWSAITDVDQMKKWYFPQLTSFKAEEGFETTFSLQHENRTFTHLWKILEVIPYQRIKYQWNYKEFLGDSFVSFDLIEENGKTKLKIYNEVLEDFPQDIPEFKRESGVEGWNYLIKQSLKQYLEAQEAITTDIQQLPITEKEISQRTNAPVFSPVLCADLSYLGIDMTTFIDFFKDSFIQMPFDYYDVKRKQWELLSEEIRSKHFEAFKMYYLDNEASLSKFADELKLNKKTRTALQEIQPWRRRSVCSFNLEIGEEIKIQRFYPDGFEQALNEKDVRSLPRIFQETKSELVENELFSSLLKKIAQYAQEITPHVVIENIQITAHFMSVKARTGVPGNNSPEGTHEDGADFIVSALVINRANILGGKSQVFEKMEDGELINIFERELQAGEFLFQADTGEEKHYGNDLWHYVTPFYVEAPVKEAWRDIIGLDIVITQPKI